MTKGIDEFTQDEKLEILGGVSESEFDDVCEWFCWSDCKNGCKESCKFSCKASCSASNKEGLVQAPEREMESR